ncbi:hypothetical protein HanRHA438_Chr15g0688971 [Helianthus annuus]|nr:hypothetical protein HanRHA438_Chr15g0688971 [Helianthus annuus]
MMEERVVVSVRPPTGGHGPVVLTRENISPPQIHLCNPNTISGTTKFHHIRPLIHTRGMRYLNHRSTSAPPLDLRPASHSSSPEYPSEAKLTHGVLQSIKEFVQEVMASS